MEPVDDTCRHEAKRRRLDESPSPCVELYVEKTRDPGASNQATYADHFQLSTGHPNVSSPASWSYSPAVYPITADSESQSNFPIAFNFHTQSSNWTSQSYETLGPIGDSSGTQFFANVYPCGPFGSVPWDNSLPGQIPTEPFALWNPYEVPVQVFQAPMFIQTPCEPYSAVSFQSPVIPQQSSESLSTATGVGVVENCDDTPVPQSNADQGLIVCFGTVSGYTTWRKKQPS